MSVIRTDAWLLDLYHHPIKLCAKLKSYFERASEAELYNHLTIHGMYRPDRQGLEQVKALQNNKVWEIVQKDERYLREKWEGPDVPIFIFPVDGRNQKIQRDLKGKSGLAYKDKLFLFVSDENTEKEIRALFTHEYNHVCRLASMAKKEEHYVLLDTVVMEGLAENAVRERFGEELLAGWTSYYTDEELEKMWKQLIRPNRDILTTDRRHQELLYGLKSFHPKMLGYCVGYYLVKKYIEEIRLSSKALLQKRSEAIAKIRNDK